MAFTDHSDIYAEVHEDGFNFLLRHFRRQRPSLFNYATPDIIEQPRMICIPITTHPAVDVYDDPVISELPYLPVPGYFGAEGISWSVQLTDLDIDFHPENTTPLPEELSPLGAQQLSLRSRYCIGLACPEQDELENFIPAPGQEPDFGAVLQINSPTQPFPYAHIACFCLSLYVTARMVRLEEHIELQLIAVELRDIEPDQLEQGLECYTQTMLRVAIFPQLRLLMEDLIFSLTSFITLAPAAISATVPFNPAIADDRISIFYDIQ